MYITNYDKQNVDYNQQLKSLGTANQFEPTNQNVIIIVPKVISL